MNKVNYTFLCLIFLFSCAGMNNRNYNSGNYSPPTPSITTYKATYEFSLTKVERPVKATKRFGKQKVDILKSDSKYKYFFEDNLVKVLWVVTNTQILFRIENKTDYSIKIPWDEAAYVDKNGSSHRVMHSGVKYTNRDAPQPPSVIVRRGSLEDIVFPTDYVRWNSGSRYTSGSWVEDPLFLDYDFHSSYSKGNYSTFDDFNEAVTSNEGKQIQVLLPLQIQDVINDYIFTFTVISAKAEGETPKISAESEEIPQEVDSNCIQKGMTAVKVTYIYGPPDSKGVIKHVGDQQIVDWFYSPSNWRPEHCSHRPLSIHFVDGLVSTWTE